MANKEETETQLSGTGDSDAEAESGGKAASLQACRAGMDVPRSTAPPLPLPLSLCGALLSSGNASERNSGEDGSAKPSWHIIRLPLEKGKATHSSVLAWRIPGTKRGSQSRHDWATFTISITKATTLCKSETF